MYAIQSRPARTRHEFQIFLVVDAGRYAVRQSTLRGKPTAEKTAVLA